MILLNEPLEPNASVKFKLKGFPEESAVKNALEGFYSREKEAGREFVIFNMFNEQIFSGMVDEQGKVERLTITPKVLNKGFSHEKKAQ